MNTDIKSLAESFQLLCRNNVYYGGELPICGVRDNTRMTVVWK